MAHFAAVDFQQIISHFDVDAWLGQRRAQFRIPIFSVENARKTVTPVFHFVVRAQESTFDLLRLRNVASGDEHVPNRDFAEHFVKEMIDVVRGLRRPSGTAHISSPRRRCSSP